MPEYCVAYNCSNRRAAESRARGITFHKFPKKDVRKKWEVALRRKHFTATDTSVICSEHFKPEDFDRTGQIVRLRDGVIPSIFNFPVRLQRRKKNRTTSTSRRAEESLPMASMDAQETSHPPPQPNDMKKNMTTSTSSRAEESLLLASLDAPETSTSHPQPSDLKKNRTMSTSSRAEENLSLVSLDAPQMSTSHPQPQPNDDHCYALPASPASLKERLNETLARVECLKQEKKNALAREKRAKIRVQNILKDLREKKLLNEELQERLEFCPGLQTDFMPQKGHQDTKDYRQFALTLHLHGRADCEKAPL